VVSVETNTTILTAIKLIAVLFYTLTEINSMNESSYSLTGKETIYFIIIAMI
jgi:hypothetical protein